MAQQHAVGTVSTAGPGTNYLRPESKHVKIIGVEEHVLFPDIMKDIPATRAVDYAKAVSNKFLSQEGLSYAQGRTTNVTDQRLKDMDDGRITLQILSFAGAVNTTYADPETGIQMARQINNKLKQAVDANPTRFRALAELPACEPQLAIEELRRCVTKLGFVGAMIAGSIGGTGKFLDSPEFDSLLGEFEALDVPLFLHPGIIPESVQSVYYDIPGNPAASAALGAMAWGWHSEVAIHVLRLAISGVLEKHPKLKIVVGHQGEMMPMMIQRFDGVLDTKTTGLKRSVGETLRQQVWIAISGMFSLPITQIAIQTWGVERVLFANDYPFVDTQRVPGFVNALNDVVGPSDMQKILQGNAEQLFRFKA